MTTNNRQVVPGRLTAEERRTSVLAAAVTEFARSGYAGTSTEAIAHRAGISQPYLFRLFGTKKDLFIATYDLVGARIVRTLVAACGGLTGEEALAGHGRGLSRAHAGSRPAPGGAARVRRRTGRPRHRPQLPPDIRGPLAVPDERAGLERGRHPQLLRQRHALNVMSAIDLLSVPDRWAQTFCPLPKKPKPFDGRGQGPRRPTSVGCGRRGGSRMTQVIPLFLSQQVSDRSQSRRWATVRRTTRRARRHASVGVDAAGPPTHPRRRASTGDRLQTAV